MQLPRWSRELAAFLVQVPFWIVPEAYLPHSATSAGAAMRIATYNLRYDNMPDSVPVKQSIAQLGDPLTEPRFLHNHTEQTWSKRRINIAQQILGENVDVLCVQEALVRQVNDLQELLGDNWAHIGLGRDDGKTAGEYSAIYYKKSAMQLDQWDTFWLSLEPFTPGSKYPDAGSRRVCTAARFTLPNGKNFSLLNTHLDDRSDKQRTLAGSMMLMRARYEAKETGNPVIVAGDFNSPPTGTDAGAYQIITGAKKPVEVPEVFSDKYDVSSDKSAALKLLDKLAGFKLLDLRAETPREAVGFNYATFTGFTHPDDPKKWSRIDFIFGGSNGGWTATRYKVESALADDGTLASDHRPVFVDLVL